jgi:sugar (pentulose or hexulose) kinase
MKIASMDFGTSSVKMAVLNEKQEILAHTKVEYSYEVEGQKIQIDPELIYGACVKGFPRFKEHLKEIEIVVFCVCSPVFILMDREGNALYPAILHLDRRSYSQSKFILEEIGKQRFMSITGNLPFAGGVSCTSMLWLKDNCPEIYKRAYKAGHLNTFLHRRFAGNWLIDPSNASFTGLYETLAAGGWSREICGVLGIDRNLLPDIIPSMSIAGKLSRKSAAETGLREGIPVLMGANDTTSAAYGAGAVNSGDILNISGSSEIVTVTTDTPIPHEKYYVRVSMEAGKWLYLAITVGGFALEWFRKEFYGTLSKKEFYDSYLDEFVRTHTRTDVRFRPHLAGDRHSLSARTGAFTGLTLDSTREDMLLALLIGSYEPVLRTLRILEKRMKLNSRIFWTGGLVSESYQDFKRRIFKGFDFNLRKECSTLGNLRAALALM